jgi:MFS family permease
VKKNMPADESCRDHDKTGAETRGLAREEVAASKRAMAGSGGVIAGLMLVPLVGLAILGFIHFDEIRAWNWESAEHWLWLVSVLFVVASHVLMLVLLRRESSGERRPKDQAGLD